MSWTMPHAMNGCAVLLQGGTPAAHERSRQSQRTDGRVRSWRAWACACEGMRLAPPRGKNSSDDGQSARPRMLRAAARPEPRSQRDADGRMHVRGDTTDRARGTSPASRCRRLGRISHRPSDPSTRAASGDALSAAQPARGQWPGARRVRTRTRWPMATRPSLVCESSPGLVGEARSRGTVRPVARAWGAWLPDHPRESAFGRTLGRATAQRRTARPASPRDESIAGA